MFCFVFVASLLNGDIIQTCTVHYLIRDKLDTGTTLEHLTDGPSACRGKVCETVWYPGRRRKRPISIWHLIASDGMVSIKVATLSTPPSIVGQLIDVASARSEVYI